jgi:fumarylacetoacetase
VLPMTIGDFTDFYASVHHATNVGSMFRPDNPLLPNYKWVPIGYHGRASSVVPSGSPVRRPVGQFKEEGHASPTVGPSRRLDYECELGIVIGRGNPVGTPIPITEAGDAIFGFCLLNDWSARDIQPWEYQPLGPFLSKNFATTISPWIVTAEALAPFRCGLAPRPDGDPAPLPYLDDAGDRQRGALDLDLEVYLQTARMRAAGLPPERLSRSNARDLYWTPAQLVAHHASGGCNLCPGDLLGSGTVSGPTESSRGCLLELTWRGTRPLTLPSGESRRFLEDGDDVVLRGQCAREGWVPIGFGECRGRIVG